MPQSLTHYPSTKQPPPQKKRTIAHPLFLGGAGRRRLGRLARRHPLAAGAVGLVGVAHEEGEVAEVDTHLVLGCVEGVEVLGFSLAW